jgi:hypothetical protein
MCNLNQHSNELTTSCAACTTKCVSSQLPQENIQPAAPPFELEGLSGLQLALSRTLRLIANSRLESVAQDD